MILLSQLLGQPTIDLANAETTGRVRGVAQQGDRVVGVHTGEALIESASIRSFEGDAVTYEGAPHTVEAGSDSPLGRRILDEDGDELGRLADVEIEADGTITALVVDDGRTLPGTALRTIGSYAVIVAAQPDATVAGVAPGGELPPPPAGSQPA